MPPKNVPPSQSGAQPEARSHCPYCQRRFLSMDELTLHIVTRHAHKGKSREAAQAGGGK